MAIQYTYNVTDFPYHQLNIRKLTKEIRESNITKALDGVDKNETVCDIWFKEQLSYDEYTVILTNIISAHDGKPLPFDEAPKMDDGRPVVRADTRPLETQTYFTMGGDSTSIIGDGIQLIWDFSNDDDSYDGPEVPSGYKAKQILCSFCCPVYLKDGSIYFFNAPWGQYMNMDIIVPHGSYYPHPDGSIPASALGLPGTKTYTQASENVVFQTYVQKHRVYGDCPMGDELNAEGAAVDPLPVGWYLRGLIMTPDSDVLSKGFASMEMYRCHTVLLPGQTMDDLH